MISAPDRVNTIRLIEEAVKSGAREKIACQEMGIHPRTLQRWRNNGEPLEDRRPLAQRPTPKNKLTAEEVQAIIDVVSQPEFQSLPPSQIVPSLADQNIYIASESTFYRVLRKRQMQHHRGRSLTPSKRPISTHCATGSNQVWMWDITWLPGPVRGLHYYLYMILDLYSRKIVAWEIWPVESAANAAALVRRAILSEGLIGSSRPLVLHSDNGSPMKGATLLETLYQLGITPSRSRPRVSNDNPYAESLFRTCKYRPEYPAAGFGDLTQARKWVLAFVLWYNNVHKHSGLNFVTPTQRHTGQDQAVFQARKRLYEKARVAHPERWSGSTRDWTLEPVVWLNPERSNIEQEKAI